MHFSRILMNTKTTIILSTTVLAALALSFATAPLALTQAHAFWGGGWGWHHGWGYVFQVTAAGDN
jgi:Spy/CpxP family protein refolding chaperone